MAHGACAVIFYVTVANNNQSELS